MTTMSERTPLKLLITLNYRPENGLNTDSQPNVIHFFNKTHDPTDYTRHEKKKLKLVKGANTCSYPDYQDLPKSTQSHLNTVTLLLACCVRYGILRDILHMATVRK